MNIKVAAFIVSEKSSNTMKSAPDSQIVRAKENLKLSNGGPSQPTQSSKIYIISCDFGATVNSEIFAWILFSQIALF